MPAGQSPHVIRRGGVNQGLADQGLGDLGATIVFSILTGSEILSHCLVKIASARREWGGTEAYGGKQMTGVGNSWWTHLELHLPDSPIGQVLGHLKKSVEHPSANVDRTRRQRGVGLHRGKGL
jgi:hypothetical protein